MFRSRNNALNWQPREGDHVEARALVTLYEARGDFQLTIETLQRAGLGALFEAFERLRAKLEKEGLFAAENKRPLPPHPGQIGIVTSLDAAALHDVLTTLRRRMPGIPVVIYPTPVQGAGAAERIAAAIRTASQRAECDVLIVCRGGGSIEDLWQFNEEMVARTIADCHMPVVTGIGHETDFTIADFAADVRAPTPTAAAEQACPDRQVLLQYIAQTQSQLARRMRHILSEYMQRMDYLDRLLVHPGEKIRQRRDQLGHLQIRLQQALHRTLDGTGNRVAPLSARLQRGIRQHLELQQVRLHRLALNLQHLSPQSVLERGYSLVQTQEGIIVRSSVEIKPDELLKLTFAHGHAEAIVTNLR
jgi:exodeoxyribonuclease VII large subunit